MLTDSFTGRSTEMTAGAVYTFTATAGTITGRFALTVIPAETKAAPVTEEDKPETGQENSLLIYSAPGRVCILPQGSDWDGVSGSVRIFDITGRIILASDNERFNSGELNEYFPGNGGNLIIVEVTAGAKRYLGKVYLTR